MGIDCRIVFYIINILLYLSASHGVLWAEVSSRLGYFPNSNQSSGFADPVLTHLSGHSNGSSWIKPSSLILLYFPKFVRYRVRFLPSFWQADLTRWKVFPYMVALRLYFFGYLPYYRRSLRNLY